MKVLVLDDRFQLCHFSVQSVRTKEEKEVLEHFAGVVSTGIPTMFMILNSFNTECTRLSIVLGRLMSSVGVG